MLSPNVPTFVAPGDEFTVTVGVANNVEGSGKDAEVRLELATSEHVEMLDKNVACSEDQRGQGRERFLPGQGKTDPRRSALHFYRFAGKQEEQLCC